MVNSKWSEYVWDSRPLCIGDSTGSSGKDLRTYDYIHICYIHKGQGKFIDESKEIVLNAGDLLMIPAYYPFQILHSAKSFIWTNIIFQSDTFYTLTKNSPDIFQNKAPIYINHLYGSFKYLILEMKEEYNTEKRCDYNILLTELMLLIQKIQTAMKDIPPIRHKDYLSKEAILEAYSSLCKTKDTLYLSLNDLAAHFNLTPKYFSFLFKERVGLNYSEYTKKLRLEKAATFLLTTNLTTIDIATTCGFSNIKFFYGSFREKYGTTPLKFRKNQSLSACASFDTNLHGWQGYPNTWFVSKRGLETMNINHHTIALSGMCVNGKKSFTYKVKGTFTGSAYSIIFGVKNFERDSIAKKTSGLVIDAQFKAGFFLLNGTVQTSSIFPDITFAEDTLHTLTIDYDAQSSIITGTINGETISRIPVSLEDISGNIGIMASKSEVVIKYANFHYKTKK